MSKATKDNILHLYHVPTMKKKISHIQRGPLQGSSSPIICPQW